MAKPRIVLGVHAQAPAKAEIVTDCRGRVDCPEFATVLRAHLTECCDALASAALSPT